ncbi:MAG: hypothetical protein PHT84_03655 [Candidatus Pacebacteria bacterium]|nr:hypothetical protein [Candidatus Paceibacterota bacterium]
MMEVEQVKGESGAPTFVIPLREGTQMECGKTYEVVVKPSDGVIDLGAVDYNKIKDAVTIFTGCHVVYLQTSPLECVVRWKCHDSCPHVGEHTVHAVANAIAGAVASPTSAVEISRVGCIWVQSNSLYLVAGAAVVAAGALGVGLTRRWWKKRKD